MLQQLTYISTARADLIDADIDAILAASRRNNRRDGITGLLVHDGKRFLQALEGYGPLVDAAFARIKADQRHRAAVLLSVQETDVRQFGEWDMASHRVATIADKADFAATVDALLADVTDRNLRAMIGSFARIDRRAA
ncbi:MAG: hypothetical protein JWR77_342 [Rhizorhabdus sp.]|nr:hypothetical protein [Rhizorhabdus sp.]